MKGKLLLRDFEFKMLNREDNDGLTFEFSEEKIRRAVWDCDSSKSSSPYGINFGFIKEF